MMRTALVGCLTLALAAPGRSEQRPPATFESNITVVSLPVFVTDGKGHSVTGLRPEDFEVEDGGRPVRIAGFREIDAGALGDEAEAPLPPEARRQFLLLFDLSFTGVSGLMRARRAAAEFVQKGLSPSDLVAVATFSSNHGVSLLTGFTSDRAQLARAVTQLGVTQRDRQADPLGMAYDLTEVGSAFSDALPEENASNETYRAIQLRYQRSQEIAYRQRVVGLLDGLGELGKALDSVKGRKQVIFLSNGFSDSSLVGEQGEQAMADAEAVARGRVWEVPSDSRFGDAQVRQLMVDMLRSFSSSDAVVHAVDLSGLTARGDARGPGREPEFRSGRESLSEMASLSGGRLFKDTNDVGAVFRELSEVSRRYYLLAFEPEGAPRPGRFHKLKVKVRVKGTSVSHRSGYFERAPFAARPALARRFEAADLIAKGAERSLLPLAALVLPYVRAGGKVAVPVVLEAQGSDLVADGASGALGLELYGYAIGEDGGVRDFVAVASNLDLAKVGDRLRGSALQAHATFTLAPGRYSLRFLLRDALSGRSGTHWMEVAVPEAAPGEVALLPPRFMDDPQRFVVLQAPSSATRGTGSPFRVGAVAFVPRPRPVVANGREQSVCLLAQDGGRAYDAGGSFEILPALVDAAGATVPLGDFRLSQAAADDDGFRRFVLSFTPGGVAAGDYSLRVRIRDPQSGRVGESFQALRVE
ncbi:MAG: VWA domain-containing protein [Vicinamibacteria bacterium]